MKEKKGLKTTIDFDPEFAEMIRTTQTEKGMDYSIKDAVQALLRGRSIEPSQECACEGCDWYDGFNIKKDIPNCLNPSPEIDKKFLSRTAGSTCKEMQEQRIQLQFLYAKDMPWKKIKNAKNLDLAIVVAKKSQLMEAELSGNKPLFNNLREEKRELQSLLRSSQDACKAIAELKDKEIEELQLKIAILQTDNEQLRRS